MKGSDCGSDSGRRPASTAPFCAGRNSSSTIARSLPAWRGAGGVEDHQRHAHEQHEDQALVDVGDQLWRAPACGRRGCGEVPTKPSHPRVLGVGDPEHLRLLGQAVGLGDRPRVVAPAPGTVRGCADAERSERAHQREDEQRRDATTRSRPAPLSSAIANIRITKISEELTRPSPAARPGRRLHRLAGHHLLQLPLAVARLHVPGGAGEGTGRCLCAGAAWTSAAIRAGSTESGI